MEPEAAKARNHRQVQDLMKAIVGPIPVEAFLDGFLPRRKSWSKAPSHPRKHAFKVVPPNAATAEGICGPLVSERGCIDSSLPLKNVLADGRAQQGHKTLPWLPLP